VDRSRYPAFAGDHLLAREPRHLHHGGEAEESAELHGVSDLLARDERDPVEGEIFPLVPAPPALLMNTQFEYTASIP
jgi:hypothetical protein